nr:M18 family aminopeptidase [Oscillospiraceae bacterium]MBQ8245406.1 M18 family aminopeptidase [Oscillospiraceae bacterium]
MENTAKNLKAFLDWSRSSYHAVDMLMRELDTVGYLRLSEGEKWELQPGGKYYMVRGGNALIAFRIPQKVTGGFMISASHCDRPTFKVKENGTLTGKYTRLATEKYGGMLMSTWLDRPLSIAGRVLVETENGIKTRLLNVDSDLLLIPSVAIHMNRNANEGYAWNPAVDTLPLVGSETAADKLRALLEKEAGGKILGHDLYLYVRQEATVWGFEEEYISAQGLDDLQCVWGCTQGFLAAGESEAIPVLAVFDSEEVGSSSVQGAGSTLLSDVLARICEARDLDLPCMLSYSFMVSADNAHALHPNHPEYSDANNAPLPGGGVVLKFNANQRYTTDGMSAAIFRKICEKADVPVQTYYNRADLPGGSTLGCISLGHVSVLSADIGLAQLAMHSAYETASTRDSVYLEQAMKAYYETSLAESDPLSGTVLAK